MAQHSGDGLTRKQVLRLGGSAAVATAMAGFAGVRPARADTANLTVAWWGEGDQNTRTMAALDVFAKASGVKITPQPSNFAGYFERLATQVAGGTPPDLFQLYLPILAEYASRGTLTPLGDYIGSAIDVSSWSKPAVDGMYFGKTAFFVPLGLSTQPALVIDTTVVDSLGVDPITADWTIADFRRISGQIAKALKAKNGDKPAFGTNDFGNQAIVLEAWIRSQGKDLFTPEGQLGFTQDDLAAWFELWVELRKDGIAVSPKYAQNGGFDSSPLIRGLAPIEMAYSSKGIQGYQSLTTHNLNFAPFPRYSADTKRVELLAPVESMGISAKSGSKETAARLLSFLNNDPAVVKAMGVAHGVPVSAAMRKQMMESGALTATERKIYQNAEDALPFSRPRVLFPVGASKLFGGQDNILGLLNQQIAFEQIDVKSAATRFFAEARRNLR
jgi:multiple sugar transport system substrate-binding protein